MWKTLININPNMIVMYRGNDKKIFKLALDKGYIIKEKDLKRSESMRKNLEIMTKAISINPNFIKYIEPFDRLGEDEIEKLIDSAIDKGYEPKIEDLLSNKNLGFSTRLINFLIENNHPEAIKYSRMKPGNYATQYVNVSLALKNYEVTLADIEENPNLGKSSEIMDTLLKKKENASAIKYIHFSYGSEAYIEEALENGYTPTLEDIKHNAILASNSRIMRILIEADPNNILYYKGQDQQVFDYALEKGYEPKVEHISNNYYLPHSDSIMKILVTIDSDLIKEYIGNNDEVYKVAYEHGFNEEKILDYIKNTDKLSLIRLERIMESPYMMKKLIDNDVNNFKYYTGTNIEIIKYALDKNYKLDEDYFNKLNDKFLYNSTDSYSDLFDLLVDYDPNYIKYYKGIDSSPIVKAIRKGYEPSDEMISIFKENLNELSFNKVISLIVRKKPEYIKEYTGSDIEVYKYAIAAGHVPSKESVRKYEEINHDFELMAAIVEIDPDYLELYTGYKSEALSFLAGKYIPTYEEVDRNNSFYSSYIVMKKLIEIDYNYAKYMSLVEDEKKESELYELAFNKGFRPEYEDLSNRRGYKMCRNYTLMKKLIEEKYEYINYIQDMSEEQIKELYEIAFDKGFRPEYEDALAKPQMLKVDKIAKYLIEKFPKIIEEYPGSNLEIFKLALKGYEAPEGVTGSYSHGKPYNYIYLDFRNINKVVLYLIKTKDFSVLKDEKFMEDYYGYGKLLKIAIELGYKLTIDDINNRTIDFIDMDKLKKVINESNKHKCIELLTKFLNNEELVKNIIKSKNLNIDYNYIELLKDYSGDAIKFIENINKYKQFLADIGIEESQFVRYGFSISYDWLSDMINIIDNGKIQEFNKVKEWFLNNYYNNNDNNISFTKNFMKILKNYVKYPEICLEIINQQNISPELKENIDFLFESNDILAKEKIPKNLTELSNIEELFIDKYKNELEDIESKDIYEVKDILCRLLFNNSLRNINQKLDIYGDMQELRQLLFNNRNNIDISDDIIEMMTYVSMMEAIVKSDNKEYLIKVAYRILDNFKLSFKCMMLFNQFDEKMKILYEKDIIANMTMLKEENIPESLLDIGMTIECGVDVIDFSDKKYCLLYHVMSDFETPEELVKGLSSPKKNTICLSSGSNRNQTIYGNAKSTIFLTDSIPRSSFIRSSVKNMSSNGSVKNNSYEDLGGYSAESRTQRGILETSYVGSKNSEILCFREGVRFKYLALPGGRKPTKEELEIAKKYGLKFIKTQPLDTTIEEPKEIDPEYLTKKEDVEPRKEIETLKQLKERLLSIKAGPRKIAIFSDAHALFEPTLAILSDARRRGITEIYSLGDDIGTGPNPREVVELLDEYGVVSLKGNHEIYATDGIDALESHLHRTGVYEEAKNNSSWTRSKLTKEQLEKKKNDPESIVIEIGGKKVLLTHFINDYNSGRIKEIPPEISAIFQGHIHFEGSQDQITTLRGAGIGDREYKDMAYYIILTEKPEGGYEVEKVEVPFDCSSTYHDINESDLNENDKNKIIGLAGVKR